jgi:iron-sulfur cluster assembly protein
MFTLTATAAEQILRAAEVQDDEPSLRVAAKIDEDGQLVYGMGFDEERENDIAFDCEGVRVLISPRSQELLEGATLDFVELKPGEFQFVFNNPNEPTCAPATGGGCGSCGRGSSCS